MYESNTGIDLITVQEKLKQRGALEQVGGMAYLAELQDKVPSTAQLPVYLDTVKAGHQLRKAIQVATEMVMQAYDYEGDVDKLLLQFEGNVSQLTESETPQVEEHIKAVMGRVVADMEQWHYSRGSQQIRGLPTGPAGIYLDKILMGIRDTHYVTLAGRPGDGKSSLAMNIVEYLARDYVWHKPTGKKILTEGVERDETEEVRGVPVGVFTIEMDNESLGYRLLFGRAGVDEGAV